MPGFLGTEKQFQARYGKPILQSRDAKSSSADQEAGKMYYRTTSPPPTPPSSNHGNLTDTS